MFVINDRVTTNVDPRHRGTVVALLTRNWHGKTGVRVLWDSGSIEDLYYSELRLVPATEDWYED